MTPGPTRGTVARVRLRPLLLPILILVVAGCGGEDRPEPKAAAPDAAADRRAVAERTAAYLGAYVAGDGAQACAQLRTPPEQCAETLSAVGPEIVRRLPPEQRRAFKLTVADPAAVQVELAGDRATAGLAPAAEGRQPMRVALVRSGDRWLIEKLGVRK
jgi:hypothetical protein